MVCFCQRKFSTVYVNNFTFIQLDQREVKKESISKVNKIKKRKDQQWKIKRRENPSIKMKWFQW